MSYIVPPVPQFSSLDGTPLEDGMIYIGESPDARDNPISIYWDEALTIPAAQPIRTVAGYPTYQGAASQLYIAESDCLLTVLEANGETVLSNANAKPFVTVIEFDQLVADLAGTTSTTGSAMIGYKSPRSNSVATNLREVTNRKVYVMDFVSSADKTSLAGGTSVDLTYAYNLATQAAQAYSTSLQATIYAPEVPHEILSTVYLRNGQTLVGAGWGTLITCIGATDDIFVLGRGSSGIADTAGPPAQITNFRTLGGGSGFALVRSTSAGAAITDMFISSADDHIVLEDTSDVLIDNIIHDQGGVSLRLLQSTGTGTRNCAVSNCIHYNMFTNHAFGSNVFDVVFSNQNMEYTKSQAIYFIDGESHIRNIVYSGGTFLMNKQTGDHGSFVAIIYSRASDVQVKFTGWTFRNWKDYAILHNQGIGFDADFDACVFDAEATDQIEYAQSTTAKGYLNGANDRVTFTGSHWRNLLGQVIETTGNSDLHLQIDGGSVRDCAGANVILHGNTSAGTRIVVDGLNGDDTQALLSAAGSGKNYISNVPRFTTASNTIASATSLTIPAAYDFVYVTGTTTVEGIAASTANAGRRVTFFLAASQTWKNSSSFKLAGGVDFSGTVDDTITMASFDGTNWAEVCRSVNG